MIDLEPSAETRGRIMKRVVDSFLSQPDPSGPAALAATRKAFPGIPMDVLSDAHAEAYAATAERRRIIVDQWFCDVERAEHAATAREGSMNNMRALLAAGEADVSGDAGANATTDGKASMKRELVKLGLEPAR